MKHIKGYDTLRAISITFVVITHLGLYSVLPETDFFRTRVYFLLSGSTGVNIFFALSGFLITRILLLERNESGTIKLKNFYVRRFLRLLPPLLIYYTIVFFCMMFKLIAATSTGLIMSFTYLYNFVPVKYYTTELGHTWSLAVEEQFYLIWPFVLLFVFKARKLLTIIGLVVVSCIVLLYYLPTVVINSDTGPVLLSKFYFVKRWFLPAVAPIMIGSAFAIITDAWHEKLSKNVTGNRAMLFVSMVLYLSVLFLPKVLSTMYPIFLAFGVSLFLLWLFYNQDSKICRVLEFQPTVYIGKISYGIYVYHGFFIGTGPSDDLMVKRFPLNLILTIIVTIISYEFIERRVLKLKKHFR